MDGPDAGPGLDLPARSPAVVTIDLHRGHLDPEVATMPLPRAVSERVVQANVAFLARIRRKGVPIVHVVTSYRSAGEIATNPWWRAVAGSDASRANVLAHQLPGSPGLEIMLGVCDPARDLVVRTKKRYDCFVATDLHHALRALGADTVLLTGVNTNSCVLATAVGANVRDYAAVVVRECVDTMDPALNEAALAVIAQAFGWVLTVEEILGAL
ncbi:MAG: cysteine hydrolase family protein [Carbonactinosporaceae bacterium]